MILDSILNRQPVLVALTGSNGAGKTTFYNVHLRLTGLRLVNADVIARQLRVDPYAAASMASAIRRELLRQRESFVFETVFSDPAGEKLALLKEAATLGYNVILCFIGISSPGVSEERVAMRVLQGGHDVPGDKIIARFPRTLSNLASAIRELPHVRIFDNDDLSNPYRQVAVFEHGQMSQMIFRERKWPAWLKSILDSLPS